MGTTLRRAKSDTLAWGFHNYRQPVKRLAGLFVGYALRGIHTGYPLSVGVTFTRHDLVEGKGSIQGS